MSFQPAFRSSPSVNLVSLIDSQIIDIVPGIVNIEGMTGSTGYTGYTGWTGYTGPIGTGVTGYTGYTGWTGYTGYTGYTGVTGCTGWTGAPGSSRLPVVRLNAQSNDVFCVSNYQYDINLGATININMPASPADGDWVIVCDSNASFSTYNPRFVSSTSVFYCQQLAINGASSFNCNINNIFLWFNYMAQGNRWLVMVSSSIPSTFFNYGTNSIGLGNATYSSSNVSDSVYGVNAGTNLTSGSYNTIMGNNALSTCVSGTGNVAIGYDALLNSIGTNNTAIGTNAALTLSSATGNVALGSNSYNQGVGSASTVIGAYAGLSLTSGNYNTVLGFNAASGLQSGTGNIFIGANTSPLNQQGNYQLVLGDQNFETNNVQTINGIQYLNTTIGAHNYTVPITGTNYLNPDNRFRVYNATDTTKKFALDVSQVTTNTTNTFAVPNGTGVFPLLYSTASVGVGQISYPNYPYNYSLGNNCLLSSSSSFNIAIGYSVLTHANSAGTNIGIGYSALTNMNNGSRNIAIGTNSLFSNQLQNDVIAIGTNALIYSNNISSNDGDIVAIGSNVGQRYLTCLYSTIVGSNACSQVGTTTSNVHNITTIGAYATQNLIAGTNNVTIGDYAANNLSVGTYNTIVGSNSVRNLTSGTGNTVLGYNAGTTLTSGTGNIIIGSNADVPSANTSYQFVLGDVNFAKSAVATGPQTSVPWLNATIGNVQYNIPLGYPTAATSRLPVVRLNSQSNDVQCVSNYQYDINLGASINIIMPISPVDGDWVVVCDSNGSFSTYTPRFQTATATFYSPQLGINGGTSFSFGTSNSFLWFNYMAQGNRWLINVNNSSSTISFNYGTNSIGMGNVSYSSSNINDALYGVNAGFNLTSDGYNTAVGYNALFSCISGTGNVALGFNSLAASTNSNNVSIGANSSSSLTSGTLNTVVGNNALSACVSGTGNVALGYNSMTNATGSNNTVIGTSAGLTLTSSTGNTLLGASVYPQGTGSANTVVGAYACSTMTGGDYNTVMGFNAASGLQNGTGNIIIGANTTLAPNSSYQFVLGDVNFANNAVKSGSPSTVPWLSTTIGNTQYSIPLAYPTAASTRLPVVTLNSQVVDVNCVSNYQYDIGLGNTININLPTSPNDGDWVIVCDSNSTFNTYNPKFQTQTSTTFSSPQLGINGVTSFNLNTNNSIVWFNYMAQGNRWLIDVNIGQNITPTFFNYGLASIGLGNSSYSSSNYYDTLYGVGAGNSLTVGTYNTAVGTFALTNVVSGTGNVAIGYQALTSSAGASSNNLAIGANSSFMLSNGTLNTTIGNNALSQCTSGTGNIAIGFNALTAATTSNNVSVGTNSSSSLTSGLLNTALGNNTISSCVSGTGNVAIGFNSLTSTTASSNVSIGTNSSSSLTSGTLNTVIGNNTISSCVSGTGNVAIGFNALTSTTASNNVSIGTKSSSSLTSGTLNTVIGNNALTTCVSGTGNVAIGFNAMVNGTGLNNTVIGTSAGITLTNSTGNTLIGSNVYPQGTGSSNTIVGAYACYTMTGGNYNTVIGFNAASGLHGGTGNIIIGANATLPPNSSYQFVLGDTNFGVNNISTQYGGVSTLTTTIGNTVYSIPLSVYYGLTSTLVNQTIQVNSYSTDQTVTTSNFNANFFIGNSVETYLTYGGNTTNWSCSPSSITSTFSSPYYYVTPSSTSSGQTVTLQFSSSLLVGIYQVTYQLYFATTNGIGSVSYGINGSYTNMRTNLSTYSASNPYIVDFTNYFTNSTSSATATLRFTNTSAGGSSGYGIKIVSVTVSKLG